MKKLNSNKTILFFIVPLMSSKASFFPWFFSHFSWLQPVGEWFQWSMGPSESKYSSSSGETFQCDRFNLSATGLMGLRHKNRTSLIKQSRCLWKSSYRPLRDIMGRDVSEEGSEEFLERSQDQWGSWHTWCKMNFSMPKLETDRDLFRKAEEHSRENVGHL